MGNSSDNSIHKKTMGKKQKDYLKMLKKCAGLVTHACEKYGIHSQTHYNWMKGYEGFTEEVKSIQEGMIDFAESKLYENIKKGDNTSILFYLKCRAKNRGYVERPDAEHRMEYEKRKIEIELMKAEMQLAKIRDSEEITKDDDGFIDALNKSTSGAWDDVEED